MTRHHTPWGDVQTTRQITTGIHFVTTASHGGYHLDHERLAQFRAVFPLWAGDQWFEEDCDWALVALAFPQYFNDEQVRGAVQTVDCCLQWEMSARWAPVRAWLDTSEAGATILKRANDFEAETADMWEVGSSGTSAQTGIIWVSLTRVRDGAHKMFSLRGWPEQNFYSDADLEAISL